MRIAIQRWGMFALILSALTSCLPKYHVPPSNIPQPVAEVPGGGGEKPQSNSIHIALGSPTDISEDKDNYYIEKPQYTVSYNNSRGTANWVAWHLDKSYIGSQGRSNAWHSESLPAGFTIIDKNDYKRSGFDRGHLCPSADRTKDYNDNKSTFAMVNVIPQAAGNNQGPWQKLETYCRGLLDQDKELYIVAGGYGEGGVDINGNLKNTIAGGKITVPSNTWKVIVVLPRGVDDITRIDENTTIIAVDMPNTQNIKSSGWKTFGTSIDEIERKANIDLLSALNTELQAKLEAKVYN